MQDLGIAIVQKLPVEYLMLLLPALVVLGIWLFTHIRRDKQGKIYFYSQKYEDKKRNGKQDRILDAVIDLSRDMKELQFVSVNLPETRKRLAYIEYKRMGYNSWADDWVVSNGLFTLDEVNHLKAQFKNNKELKRRESDNGLVQ